MFDSIKKTELILDAISKKQEIISANITNANTPGYVRKDISFNQILETANSPLETKLSIKMGSNPLMLEGDEPVDIKREMVDMQKNLVYYTTATRRMSSVVSMLKSAAQVGR